MKKNINNLIYNTATARRLAEASDGLPENDLHHTVEALYQKGWGEFFLHGQGGPLSRYASGAGDLREGGEDIVPLTYEGARAWARSNLSPEAYDSIFGAVAPDATRIRVNLSLSVAARDQARKAASMEGRSLSAYIESLILAQ